MHRSAGPMHACHSTDAHFKHTVRQKLGVASTEQRQDDFFLDNVGKRKVKEKKKTVGAFIVVSPDRSGVTFARKITAKVKTAKLSFLFTAFDSQKKKKDLVVSK